ncbi:MAG: MBL fold metallo-hydrolase [Albidovulum sp.]|nr:MBL fold metallo-hydrolase [Albidovulum sp.]
MNQPDVQGFFDSGTNTVSYVVNDPKTGKCAVIDSVLDFDYASGCTDTESADKLIEFVRDKFLETEWILESHVHADHLSAAPYIQQELGGKIAIGENIVVVQEKFGKVFNEGTLFQRDGSQFDKLFCDGDSFKVGSIPAFVMHTPGHTPACMTFVIGDAAFCGDTVFMPDFGTARVDFPGGSAEDLYESIQKIFSLPDATRLFVGHDYKAPGRDEFSWETTVGEQKSSNVHIGSGRAKEEFVKLRNERDKNLGMPRLIVPSLQVNMRAGNMPEADDNGMTYLKVPVNALREQENQ